MQEFAPPASSEFDPDELEEAREDLTPLQFAVEYGSYEDVERALQENPDSINETEEYGNTALHMAVHQGKVKAVKLLLKSGADVNASGDLGRTPLHYAISDQEFEIAQLLLSVGADADKPDGRGNVPLEYAREPVSPGDPNFVKLLMDHGATVDLAIVMQSGDCAQARRMLTVDPNLVSSLRPEVKQRILSEGISMIHQKFQQELLEQYGGQINLQLATGGKFDQHLREVITDNRDILEKLVSQRAPRIFNQQEIDLAIKYNRGPLVELLLEFGAEFPPEDDVRRWSFIMSGRSMGLPFPDMDKPQLIEKYKPFVDKQQKE